MFDRRATRRSVEDALVQDAAYGTLSAVPRRALHARIAETLETQFTEIAENQPVVGTSLHPSRPDRESGGAVGQGRQSRSLARW